MFSEYINILFSRWNESFIKYRVIFSFNDFNFDMVWRRYKVNVTSVHLLACPVIMDVDFFIFHSPCNIIGSIILFVPCKFPIG